MPNGTHAFALPQFLVDRHGEVFQRYGRCATLAARPTSFRLLTLPTSCSITTPEGIAADIEKLLAGTSGKASL